MRFIALRIMPAMQEAVAFAFLVERALDVEEWIEAARSGRWRDEG